MNLCMSCHSVASFSVRREHAGGMFMMMRNNVRRDPQVGLTRDSTSLPKPEDPDCWDNIDVGSIERYTAENYVNFNEPFFGLTFLPFTELTVDSDQADVIISWLVEGHHNPLVVLWVTWCAVDIGYFARAEARSLAPLNR